MTKFEVLTPLGFTVRTTESYWKLLLFKHPEISGRDRDVSETLSEPNLVCRSRHDPTVYLFYRAEGDYYFMCCGEMTEWGRLHRPLPM